MMSPRRSKRLRTGACEEHSLLQRVNECHTSGVLHPDSAADSPGAASRVCTRDASSPHSSSGCACSATGCLSPRPDVTPESLRFSAPLIAAAVSCGADAAGAADTAGAGAAWMAPMFAMLRKQGSLLLDDEAGMQSCKFSCRCL